MIVKFCRNSSKIDSSFFKISTKCDTSIRQIAILGDELLSVSILGRDADGAAETPQGPHSQRTSEMHQIQNANARAVPSLTIKR